MKKNTIIIIPISVIIVIGVALAVLFSQTEPISKTGGLTDGGQSQDQSESDVANGQDGSQSGPVIDSVARFFGRQSKRSAASVNYSSSSAGSSSYNYNTDPSYRTWNLFGTNTSGLEFSGLFQANTEQTYTYFKNKGFNTIRLPFDWDELQPDMYGNFDSTSKQHLDENIQWAHNHGLSVILDAHSYGRRYVYRNGGFHDDFSSSQQHTFTLPYGDHDSTNATLTFRDYGRGVAGTFSNPVVPATGYNTTFDMRIDSNDGGLWNEFYMDTCYKDENNRYSFVANPAANEWSLRKTINGSSSTLASGSKTWTAGQYYSISIDVNQASAGKINVSVDGTPLFSANTVNSDPALTSGKISMAPSGVKATIKNFILDVNGDTSSGGPVQLRVTDAGLPVGAWKDFWTKMAEAYKDDDTIIGYDQNEPHDMPVPTTPQNYSVEVAASNHTTEATATVLGQSMVDAIRSAGDDKFVVVEMDHWANAHYFSTQYGPSPTPWITDTLIYPKIVYSGHYYFDSDHSGTYPSGATPPSSATIDTELIPFFSWCKSNKQICYVGEFGVPNTEEWQPVLSHFLDTMKQYDIWWTQWAGGNLYASQTTLQPTNSFTTDRMQMVTITNFLGSQ